MTEWRERSAAEQGRAIADGSLDPVELAQHYLDAIAAKDPDHQIYARATPERALAEARAAAERARNGLRLGPLDGVPVSWKDLFDSAGTATEAGTALMAQRIPPHDAEVLRHATAMGAVCLGKTHLSEIAFSGLGLNPMTATSPNKGFPGHAPGGSSSGAAASLAFKLAPLAMGTDTGGSVRVPAAWNDLVGLKTTHGAISLKGTVPLAAEFDTIGPLARTVEDAALGFALLGGDRVDLDGATLARTQLAALETIVLEELAPEVAQGYETALARLERAGATITRLKAPELDEAFALAGPLYTADAWSFWGPYIEAAPDKMWHHIRDRVEVGASVLAADYLRAWQRLRQLRAQFHERIAGYDALLCPTVAILPPEIAPLLADDALYRDTNLLALRNTRVGNLMGLCGLSLPSGTPGVGLLLNGLPQGEGRLLRLGAAAARALA